MRKAIDDYLGFEMSDKQLYECIAFMVFVMWLALMIGGN